eukprot:1990465-Rhodomonas_salina.1
MQLPRTEPPSLANISAQQSVSSAAARDNSCDLSAAPQTSVAAELGNSSAAARDNSCDLLAAPQT